jgi:hypothetical protein
MDYFTYFSASQCNHKVVGLVRRRLVVSAPETRGLIMKIAILTLLVGLPLATPVADTVPKLNFESSCKAAMSADQALGADRDQSYQACMNDESSAQQELTKVWTSYSAPLRTRCELEASAGGLPSYVDMLVCLQVAGDNAASTPVTPLKGAGKRRVKN